jgi:radical SAM protein with 4Fe4S-binding SPASM domain
VRDLLDNIFVVNVNGDVFTRPFAYDAAFRIGNIGRESMVEMVASETYRACQGTVRLRKERNCLQCEFGGFCDSSPMHEHGSVDRDGRCLVHRRTIGEIETALRVAGVDRAVIAEWARKAAPSGTPTVV